MTDLDKLTEMVNGYPQTISDLEDSIAALEVIITDLGEQRQAIENEVLAPLTSASNVYGEAKADSYGVVYSFCTSGSYGVSNLTEWAVVSGGCPPDDHNVVFKDSDVSSTVDAEQYQRQLDFAEAYGHIHDEVGASGTYGIADTVTNLQTGKNIQTINKNKIEAVKTVYEKFT